MDWKNEKESRKISSGPSVNIHNSTFSGNIATLNDRTISCVPSKKRKQTENEFPIRSDKYVSTKQTNDNSMLDSVSGCKQAHKNEEPPSTPPKKIRTGQQLPKNNSRIHKRTDEEANNNDVQILEQLKNHHFDEESQRGRHLCRLLIWSVVDKALKSTQHKKLLNAIPALNRIINEGKIGTTKSSIINRIQHWLAQLWAKILSDAFNLNIDSFEPTWELHHQIPGDKFEVDGVRIHKDFAVVVAEAVYTLNRILSTYIILESEISKVRVHVALTNNAHIRLGILRPLYNHESNCIIYIYDQDVKSFDLQSGCMETDIENVFNLINYLRQVVCKDGQYMKNLLNRESYGNKRKFYPELPRIPLEAEKSKTPKINITPMVKRVRYEVNSNGYKNDKDNSSYYCVDSMTPEEDSISLSPIIHNGF
ncbi:11675_t:CDS:2 [Gigaspora margarita]|uniref:11675_t:CDS:1 n=1 Tax=Gigaspora margarita TaxID=4874 RepID=A0ABN7UE55_GIGMA|nr:11675_t:CDS:2 [Gigaspora margarita]